MNIEEKIKDVISKSIEEGIIEKAVKEQFESSVKKAVSNLFDNYGDITQIIKKEIKSVMVPYLENYDYSDYIVKLDAVLVEILQNTTTDNKKILQNFKELMTQADLKGNIKLSEIFKVWKKYVSKNIDTSNLDVITDDSVYYAPVDVTLEVEEVESRSWSNYQRINVCFECEKDEKMNIEIGLHRWKDSKEQYYTIDKMPTQDIASFRHLSDFEIYLYRINQNFNDIEIDVSDDSDYIDIEAEPEASFS